MLYIISRVDTLNNFAHSYTNFNDTFCFTDPEALKFRDVEKRFLRQFKMPQEEKLVNCMYVA